MPRVKRKGKNCRSCDSPMPPNGKRGFFKNGIDTYFHAQGCPSRKWRTIVLHDNQKGLREELEREGYTVIINKPVPMRAEKA